MSKDLNRVMLIGRLGTDPEMRFTPQGTAVTTFRLAVNRRARQAEGQEPREETDWFTVVAWQQLADICNRYLKKAARVYIEGRLQVRSWEDQSGQRRTTTEIVASDMIMLDGKRPEGGSSGEVEEFQVDEIPF
jgi:single-strand DNA-binding protein